jgi:hypothetical protein
MTYFAPEGDKGTEVDEMLNINTALDYLLLSARLLFCSDAASLSTHASGALAVSHHEWLGGGREQGQRWRLVIVEDVKEK